VDVTVHAEDRPDDARERASAEHNLKAAGPGFQFGPEGTVFERPVTISLPYDPSALNGASEDDLKVHYWNPHSSAWEALPSVVDKQSHCVTAQVGHFSFYQVLAPAAPATAAVDPGFSAGAVYAFPNPASGVAPTIHLEVGLADMIELKIYDAAGELVHEASLSGAPAAVNGVPAYEYAWDTSSVASGLYLFRARARRSGYSDILLSGKVAVLR
jgi:hypothetical protein